MLRRYPKKVQRKKPFLILGIISYLLVSFISLGQERTEISTREELYNSIKIRAQKDAQAGKPPAGPQDLHLLFGQYAEAEGIKLQEVVEIYEDAYETAKPQGHWWDALIPSSGWIAATIFFLLLVFGDVIKGTISPKLKKFADKIYNRVAGYQIFWGKSLKKYRASIITQYQKFKIPFKAERFLNMGQIYVPLKIKGTNDTEQTDDLRIVAKYRLVMITGAPGSGKSMLLRRIALTYAAGGAKDLREQAVPILFELSRLNKSDKSIIEHLVDIFTLNKFPDANNFLEANLGLRTVILLFDGLDEVNSQRRAHEVAKIRDFLRRYDSCRAVITCRNAVYRGEFDDLVDQTLEIVDFSDQQIQKFLFSWPDVPPAKSVSELLLALRQRPRIMALARNPLLLTIIAFLFSDVEEFELPHSRAEFYSQAVEVLLGRLKGDLNRFKASQKQLVVEHLALFNQSRGSENQSDRLSLDLRTILAEIKKVLPDLNLESKHADAILDEITERSGLLLPIDGGTRYQFSHLTLQEFFAASALRQKPDQLLGFLNDDRDAWRETVKLWCGLSHDSTDVIGAIYEQDPITAFECLADALMVSNSLADAIVNAFKSRLDINDPDAESIIKAFALVASGPSKRSRDVFCFLSNSLLTISGENRIEAAATALSLTNKATAAQVLAEQPNKGVVRSALIRMGDLAVPMLSAQAQKGSWEAAVALYEIGTPNAAKALVPLLWHDNPLEVVAAQLLGNLITNPNIASALSNDLLTKDLGTDKVFDWVWRPFSEPANSLLPTVAGRIAFLLSQKGSRVKELPLRISACVFVPQIDKRIIIPIAVSLQENLNLRLAKSNIFYDRKHDIERGEISFRLFFGKDQFHLSQIALLDQLFSWLDSVTRVRLFERLFIKQQPTLNDWLNVLRPSEYSLAAGWHIKVVDILVLIPCLFGLLEIFLRINSGDSSLPVMGIYIPLIAPALLIIVGMVTLIIALWSNSLPALLKSLFGGIYYGPRSLINVIRESGAPDIVELIPLTLYAGIMLLFSPLVLYLSTLFISRYASWTFVITFFLILLSSIFCITWIALRKAREATNPLHGILDPEINEEETIGTTRQVSTDEVSNID